MKKSKALQEAIGYKSSRMNFKALGLISGMFYITRKDKLILPCYHVTSKGDILERYTLDFAGEHGEEGL